LAYNQLVDIPPLQGLPALTELSLAHNTINGPLTGLQPLAKSLQRLDISHNLFDFTYEEFIQASGLLAR